MKLETNNHQIVVWKQFTQLKFTLFLLEMLKSLINLFYLFLSPPLVTKSVYNQSQPFFLTSSLFLCSISNSFNNYCTRYHLPIDGSFNNYLIISWKSLKFQFFLFFEFFSWHKYFIYFNFFFYSLNSKSLFKLSSKRQIIIVSSST
jgi:hypothetical protein